MKLKLSCKEKSYKELHGYSDANWAENRKDRKSNSGFICLLNGGTVSWACRKQDCVSLSSTEAEYVALAETTQELIWLTSLCKDFEIQQNSVKVYEDNQSCIKMTENQRFSNRTKHIDAKYHFLRDLKNKIILKLEYCPTSENIADMLTKPLSGERTKKLR